MNTDSNSNNGPANKFKLGTVLSFAIPAIIAVWFVGFIIFYAGIGFRNPVTPAGYAGYVTRGAVTGKSKFVDVQYGPTSTGPGWLLSVTNVPLTPRTFEEDFSGAEGITSGDNTRIAFAINVTMRIRHSENGGATNWVRTYVEQFTTLHEGDTPEQIFANTYASNLKARIRGFARVSAETHKGLDIQDNMPKIAADVFAKAQEYTATTPFEIIEITVGRIHYPDTVTDQVANNLIATQKVAQQNINTDLIKRDAKMMVIDNEGLAAAADIINKSITPQWLQYQALLAQQENVKSLSATHLMIEVGPMGVPVAPESK